MSKILVFGHQNPDSDAIGSSVAFAYLAKEAYGLDTVAVALGTPNEETAFVLDYFGVEAPRVITSVKAEGAEQVILTDHNEFQLPTHLIKSLRLNWLNWLVSTWKNTVLPCSRLVLTWQANQQKN